MRLKRPARKSELLEYARRQEGGEAAAATLRRIADREYTTLDEVGEELAQVQPSFEPPQADLPQAESGEPPGREAYARA